MAYKKGPATFMKGQTKNKAVGYMTEGSAGHMDSVAKKTNLDEFGNPIPEGFKADAPGVTGTSKKISTKAGGNIVDLEKGQSVSTQDAYKIGKIKDAKQGYGEQLTKKDKKKVAKLRLNDPKKSPSEIAKVLGLGKRITVISKDS